MPRPSHHSLTLHKKPRRHLFPIYAASLLLIFHTALVNYINSSFLEQFVTTAAIGTIYTIGSALSVLIFLFISRVLHRVGNYRLMLYLLLLDFMAVSGMAFAETLRVAVPLFLLNLVSVPLIIFNLDVFLEEQIGTNEDSTGSRRGLLLTLLSLIGAVSPLIGTMLINETTGSFTYSYLLSAFTLIPIMAILIFSFRDFSDPKYNQIDLFSALRTFWRNSNIRNVFLTNFTLQMFFLLMVVYTPLYLTHEIGLSWTDFGIIMFFAQLAYVVLEYPIGIIADKYIGEKEMMAFGFFIMIISTSWMSFVTVPDILVWSLILFVTRTGASFVEVTTESYFFKQIKSSDAQVISFFRLTRPLSYVVGALIASFALLYLPFNLLFTVFAILMVPALFFTLNIVDSK
ncbi:MAG: hypothetical protein RLZZ230_112 [Candidatus Parcubacteria bacterium]|jgi:MFS family permease